MSTEPVGEEYVLQDGEGLIDIRGDGFDSGLLVAGEPVAFSWSDCEGSIAQYLVRSRETADLSQRLRALRHVAGGGLDPDAPLAPQIRPLLALLRNGTYRLGYTTSFGPYDVIAYDERFSYAEDRDSFYPLDGVLITTQPSDSLRRDRIDSFCQRISAGKRPIVFVAGVAGGYASFVLDGHHKLQAYRELQLPPAVLSIVKETEDPIALEDGIRMLGPSERYRKDYRRVKQQHGSIVTESDWLSCTAPWKMVHYTRKRSSDRKRRLVLCACCRRLWRSRTVPWMTEPCRRAIEVAERFADGLAGPDELAEACRAADSARGGNGARGIDVDARRMTADACRPTVEAAPALSGEQDWVIGLMRDVFGNPFRLVAVEPGWRTQTVLALAQAASEVRVLPEGLLDTARLVILADALEEAGCDNSDLLLHLRSPGQHVRGCWGLDLILGRD
jgi:hypothetical protein